MKNKKQIFVIIMGIAFIGAVLYFASVYQKVKDTARLTPEEFEEKYVKD